ncbi:phosphate signaling complex protein PhoU [Rhodococcus tibetensis]|uniref:Phosphate-specific transport system accessory protein PhoU n=1 Tax=Rhodococcus tibetensis TaxID=2965064 RepID=A0ABT1QJS5_9NOCA|nr:phosphate signaling complex protein PhoU [Rhodococcus sp. FXJ9.536]MCQ4122501.1 phosphate signaling complex protein PhoU [Rhodococcus sp. FXJ9.536]
MRTRFAENIDSLAGELAAMCRLTVTAMREASGALLQADLGLAEHVIDVSSELDAAASRWEQRAFSLLALQAPVAHDLRFMVGGLHISADLHRMGGLAVHIAKIVRRRHPEHVVPEEVLEVFTRMGAVAVAQAEETEQVLQHRDPERALGLLTADDTMDDLHRGLFAITQDDDWPHGVTAAVDITLLGRFYERFCDHTVEIGRRVIFLETGVLPEQG